MRAARAFTIAVTGLVAVLPLLSPSHAQTRATQPGPVVRMEAVDALIAQTVPRKPAELNTPRLRATGLGATGLRATAAGSRRQTPVPPRDGPVQLTFFGDSTSWTLPEETPASIPGATAVLQCVPYARYISGIAIYGDAWTWWDKAAGIFARGNHPEPGAVLSFPGTDRMPLGHVAVVHRILGPRKILIDHANWPTSTILHGAISRDMLVMDVSPANDWSEVRVQFGEGGGLGSVYPANGFIYGWSETGARIARPRYALDNTSEAALGPSWRMFNAISYVWALPPAARDKAYAAAGVIPKHAGSNPAVAANTRGRPMLMLGSLGSGLLGSSLAGGGTIRTLGFQRLELGPGGRPRPGFNRFVMQ